MADGKVRLSDVAREAQVSLGAAAKVLSGAGGNIRVSAQKAEHIRAVAHKMQYRPNIAARTLAGSSARVVGILLDAASMAYYYRTVLALEAELAQADYRIMISEVHNNVDHFLESYRTLLQYGVDGVICVSHDYPGENHRLDESFQIQPNTLLIGRPAVGVHLVDIDWASSTEQATRYLLGRGRRRVALLLSESGYVSRFDREKGFKLALQQYPEAQEHSRIFMLPPMGIRGDIRELMRFVLDQLLPDVDAVMLESDVLALHLMSELHRRGIRVPEDIAVIGHNNDEFAGGAYPPLASIDECGELQAAAAVRILLGQIRNQFAAPQKEVIVPKLVWRESAG